MQATLRERELFDRREAFIWLLSKKHVTNYLLAMVAVRVDVHGLILSGPWWRGTLLSRDFAWDLNRREMPVG